MKQTLAIDSKGYTEHISLTDKNGKFHDIIVVHNAEQLQEAGALIFIFNKKEGTEYRREIIPPFKVDKDFESFFFKSTIEPIVELYNEAEDNYQP